VSWDLFSQKLNCPEHLRAMSSREQNTKVEELLDTLFTRIKLSILIEVLLMKIKEIMKKMRSEEVKVN
jgi:hypothetical protein